MMKKTISEQVALFLSYSDEKLEELHQMNQALRLEEHTEEKIS